MLTPENNINVILFIQYMSIYYASRDTFQKQNILYELVLKNKNIIKTKLF